MRLIETYTQKKRQLCLETAKLYREKSNQCQQYAEYLESVRCPNPIIPTSTVKLFLNGLGNFQLERRDKYRRKAEEYEKLARSGSSIHFRSLFALWLNLRLESE